MTWTDDLVAAAARLRDACEGLRLGPPVTHVYNPLAYAWAPFEAYLRRYARPRPDAVLVGMNPGPFGMLQTGVPFGEVNLVRDWMKLGGEVNQPPAIHPKRPIEGYACRRSEVSGKRVWGWARDRFGTPEAFFARFLVLNYCPLGLFDAGGENRTPDKLKGADQAALYEVCDRGLGEMLGLIAPKAVIGIGRFAEQRAEIVARPLGLRVFGVTHPSPANPKAHAGWDKLMDAALAEHGL